MRRTCPRTITNWRVARRLRRWGRKNAGIRSGKVTVDGEEHIGLIASGAPAGESYMKQANRVGPVPWFVGVARRRLTASGSLQMLRRAAAAAGINKKIWNHLFRH